MSGFTGWGLRFGLGVVVGSGGGLSPSVALSASTFNNGAWVTMTVATLTYTAGRTLTLINSASNQFSIHGNMLVLEKPLGASGTTYSITIRETSGAAHVDTSFTVTVNAGYMATYDYEFSSYDPSKMKQDSAGTTPVTADGDPVGLWNSTVGSEQFAQATSGARLTYKTNVANGKSSLYSAGTAGYMDATTAGMNLLMASFTSNRVTITIAIMPTQVTTVKSLMGWFNGATSVVILRILSDGTYRAVVGSTGFDNLTSLNANQVHFITFIVDGWGANDNCFMTQYRDGISRWSGVGNGDNQPYLTPTTAAAATVSASCRLFSKVSLGEYFQGHIFGIKVAKQILTKSVIENDTLTWAAELVSDVDAWRADVQGIPTPVYLDPYDSTKYVANAFIEDFDTPWSADTVGTNPYFEMVVANAFTTSKLSLGVHPFNAAISSFPNPEIFTQPANNVELQGHTGGSHPKFWAHDATPGDGCFYIKDSVCRINAINNDATLLPVLTARPGTYSVSGTTVTGTGTDMNSADQNMFIYTSAGTYVGQISQVNSATSATLLSTGTTITGQTCKLFKPLTTGAINTYPKLNKTYGNFRARFQVTDNAIGFWWAFWTMLSQGTWKRERDGREQFTAKGNCWNHSGQFFNSTGPAGSIQEAHADTFGEMWGYGLHELCIGVTPAGTFIYCDRKLLYQLPTPNSINGITLGSAPLYETGTISSSGAVVTGVGTTFVSSTTNHLYSGGVDYGTYVRNSSTQLTLNVAPGSPILAGSNFSYGTRTIYAGGYENRNVILTPLFQRITGSPSTILLTLNTSSIPTGYSLTQQGTRYTAPITWYTTSTYTGGTEVSALVVTATSVEAGDPLHDTDYAHEAMNMILSFATGGGAGTPNPFTDGQHYVLLDYFAFDELIDPTPARLTPGFDPDFDATVATNVSNLVSAFTAQDGFAPSGAQQAGLAVVVRGLMAWELRDPNDNPDGILPDWNHANTSLWNAIDSLAVSGASDLQSLVEWKNPLGGVNWFKVGSGITWAKATGWTFPGTAGVYILSSTTWDFAGSNFAGASPFGGYDCGMGVDVSAAPTNGSLGGLCGFDANAYLTASSTAFDYRMQHTTQAGFYYRSYSLPVPVGQYALCRGYRSSDYLYKDGEVLHGSTISGYTVNKPTAALTMKWGAYLAGSAGGAYSSRYCWFGRRLLQREAKRLKLLMDAYFASF